MFYLRYLCLFTYSGVQHILYCVFCFVLVICMVVSYTYCIVSFVLSSLCVWWCPIHIVLCLLLLCLSSSCVLSVTSFSVLSILEYPFGFSNVYLNSDGQQFQQYHHSYLAPHLIKYKKDIHMALAILILS